MKEDGRGDIKYESTATLQYCRYMNTIMEGMRCLSFFSVARGSGLSYDDALSSTGALLNLSVSAVRRRLADIENIRLLFQVAKFDSGKLGPVFFEQQFTKDTVAWISDLYQLVPKQP